LRILEGATFCICDEVGDLHHQGEGLFSEDTRFLSRFKLTINGHRPLLLSSDKIEYFSAAFFMRNPLSGGLPQDVLSIRRERFVGADHDVRLLDGSLAAIAAGEELHGTKSHHHQAVGRIGEGFEVTGFSTLDELPEAIEIPSCRFVLGVQWHPEADEQSRVIGALVERARDYRSALGSV